jgi:hypothetical protein
MHPWKECFGNPCGNNFRPNFVLTPPTAATIEHQQQNTSEVQTMPASNRNERDAHMTGVDDDNAEQWMDNLDLEDNN